MLKKFDHLILCYMLAHIVWFKMYVYSFFHIMIMSLWDKKTQQHCDCCIVLCAWITEISQWKSYMNLGANLALSEAKRWKLFFFSPIY